MYFIEFEGAIKIFDSLRSIGYRLKSIFGSTNGLTYDFCWQGYRLRPSKELFVAKYSADYNETHNQYSKLIVAAERIITCVLLTGHQTVKQNNGDQNLTGLVR